MMLHYFEEKFLNKLTHKQHQLANWVDGFNALKEYLNSSSIKGKKAVFINEFAWLDSPKSNFLMAFKRFWNEYASRKNDIVIVI